MALTRFDRFTLTFVAITASSLTTRLISTAILTRLAATLTAAPNFALAITTSVFEIFALFALITAVSLFLRRVNRCLILIAWIPGAALCFIGSLLALVSLGLTIHYANDNVLESSVRTDARELAAVGLTMTLLGLIPETMFYILIWPHQRIQDACTVEKQDRPSFTHTEKQRSVGVHLSALSPVRAKLFKSSGGSDVHSHSSCKSAIGACSKCLTRHGMSSTSSKTKLLLGDSRSLHSRADSVATSEPSRANSDFENWDTSAVEAFDNTFSQKTFLEPIPGSRPVSPANPLDGPFGRETLEPNEIPLPESPPHPSAVDCGASFRTFRRPSEHEESYYHPLFRGESPAPPPLISPGTVITASPFAGEVVSPEFVAPRILHSAASSRPASPGLLSPTRSHAGSIRSFRTVPTSPTCPLSPLEPIYLAPSHRSGSISPP